MPQNTSRYRFTLAGPAVIIEARTLSFVIAAARATADADIFRYFISISYRYSENISACSVLHETQQTHVERAVFLCLRPELNCRRMEGEV